MLKLATSSLLLLFSLQCFAQKANDAFIRGNKSASKGSYAKAIKYYNIAILKDSSNVNYREARAQARFGLKDYKGALIDYTFVIIRNRKDTSAIYNHAVCKAALGSYKGAIADIRHLLELNPRSGEAWIFMAQLEHDLSNDDSACVDFEKAYSLNQPGAAEYMQNICKKLKEDYVLLWDSAQGWKGYTRRNDEKQVVREVIRRSENLEHYSQKATITIYKNKAHTPLRPFMNGIKKQSMKDCPTGKFQLIEEDSTSSTPAIIFSMECADEKNGGKPLSQLIKVVQGKVNLFLIEVNFSKGNIPDDLISGWLQFLQKGYVQRM